MPSPTIDNNDPVTRELQAACRELAWARRRQLELAMEGQILSSARFAEYARQVRRRIATPPKQWLADPGGGRWQSTGNAGVLSGGALPATPRP